MRPVVPFTGKPFKPAANRRMGMSMKKLLVIVALGIVALGIVVAAPAFAQQDPNDPNDPGAHHRARAFEQRQSKMIPPYARDIYYERNNDFNPDFPLGDTRWRTLHHRAHPASPRHKTAEQK
jgi:hypothetical protein